MTEPSGRIEDPAPAPEIRSELRPFPPSERLWCAVLALDVIDVLLVHPPALRLFSMIELANVGLDVEEGRFVEDVHPANLQDVTSDREQLDDRDSYGIWPVEVAYGKDPARLFTIEKGLLKEGAASRPMKLPVESGPGEGFEVL